jgi:hypothetical protein
MPPLAALAALALCALPDRAVYYEFEGAAVWQSRNVVRIPDEGGTRFGLTDLGHGGRGTWRTYLGLRLDRHELRALAAPLTIEVSGALPGAVSFQGQRFAGGVPTDGIYRFDSYRLTYRYAVVATRAWSVKLGATAKVRDASIRLRQAGVEAVRSDTGFVPLLHAAAEWRFSHPLSVVLDVDALAAPQGRAEDVGLFAVVHFSPQLQLRAGYRMVEGGVAGGGGVYNFAWLHQAAAAFVLVLG